MLTRTIRFSSVLRIALVQLHSPAVSPVPLGKQIRFRKPSFLIRAFQSGVYFIRVPREIHIREYRAVLQ